MRIHFFTAPFYFAFIWFRVQGSWFMAQGSRGGFAAFFWKMVFSYRSLPL